MARTKTITPGCRATKPEELTLRACAWCAGNGWEPDEECAPIPCLKCDGSGYDPQVGDLGPTNSYKSRPFEYHPGSGDLKVTRVYHVERYKLAELLIDQDPARPEHSRVIECTKVSDGEVHHVHMGSYASCTCAGKSFESSAKANWRAWLEGDPQYPTLGCIHLDACALFLRAGLFDLPNPNLARAGEAA